MEKMTITSITAPGKATQQTLFFLKSLRHFAGEIAHSRCLVSTTSPADAFSRLELDEYKRLNAELVSFSLPKDVREFPFASLVNAAAVAEEHLNDSSALQVWLLPDTFVLQPPLSFLLKDGINFAYRPVHHALVGSVYDQPLDEFWRMVYGHCQVPEERIFPMDTCVRDHVIRPYFNAGMLVTRPEQGLMRAWREKFMSIYQQEEMRAFYQGDQRYAIFIHQAVLAGVVLNMYEQRELFELPETINYPLHLHAEYHPDHKAEALDDLVTVRYESLDELPEWLAGLEVGNELRHWLENSI